MSLKEKMTALADAVREKAELTDNLTIDEMTEAVNGLVVNGIEVDERTLTVTPSKSQQNFTSSSLGENAYYSTVTVNAIPDEYITTDDVTAVSSDILEGKTAYIAGRKVTGTMANVGALKIEMSPNNSDYYNEGGYVSILQIYAHSESKSFTPSTELQTYTATEKFIGSVTIDPIPDEYIITTDATATSGSIIEGETAYVKGEKVTGKYIPVNEDDVRAGVRYGYNPATGFQGGTFTLDATAEADDILEGKTAYVNGEKVTGTLKEAQQSSVEANAVTIFPGIVSEEYTVTVAEMAAVTVDSNVVTVPAGYNSAEQIITVGTAKEAETFTPGTSDITIPADTYLTGEQVIRGDSNLTPENIKTGVSIFDVEGIFTADADAEASDIAQGKTAYVNGEKITGTASGGAVIPAWCIDNYEIKTTMGVCDSFAVPAREGDGSFKVFDGKLIWFRNGYIPQQADKTINWTYVFSRESERAIAIGNGQVYNINVNPIKSTLLYPAVTGVTQIIGMSWGFLFCTSEGDLYAGSDGGKYVRVEYKQQNSTDPVVYAKVSKILNFYQSYDDFWVITDDGSLASGTINQDYLNSEYAGAATIEIDDQSVANGNPFVNYFYDTDTSGSSYIVCELAFRSDGLWYRESKRVWQNGRYYYNAWSKADDPGLMRTNWLGKCKITQSTDSDGAKIIKVDQVALAVDTQGRLWQIAPRGQVSTSSNKPTLAGLDITQIGEDNDWQYAPPSITRAQSGQGRLSNNSVGQKGGNLINMWGTNTNVVEVNWEEYPVCPPGRMIGCYNNLLYFAPEGASVDMSKAGGTF